MYVPKDKPSIYLQKPAYSPSTDSQLFLVSNAKLSKTLLLHGFWYLQYQCFGYKLYIFAAITVMPFQKQPPDSIVYIARISLKQNAHFLGHVSHHYSFFNLPCIVPAESFIQHWPVVSASGKTCCFCACRRRRKFLNNKSKSGFRAAWNATVDYVLMQISEGENWLESLLFWLLLAGVAKLAKDGIKWSAAEPEDTRRCGFTYYFLDAANHFSFYSIAGDGPSFQ